MAAMTGLLEEHIKALSADFRATISTLEAKLDHIQATVQKFTLLESNANLQDERLLALETTCATLTESSTRLLAKTIDLESRSLRNNI